MNEVALLPAMPMLEIVSAAVPVFLRVTAFAAVGEPSSVDANDRLVGERLTTGTPTPVPLIATVCGEPVTLSAMLIEAGSAPTAVGLKVTEMVQEALAASDVPQVLV